MTEHPVEAAWWDEERNGWVHPGGILVPAELIGGRDLPAQTGRAAPFGLAYGDYDECTCDIETAYEHLHGRPLVTTRTPDPHDPCPVPGHDQPAAHRHREK